MKNEAELKELLFKCPVAGSVWRHRKGGLYVVATAVIIEATLEPAVIYVRRGSDGAVKWSRPLSEFMDGRFKHEPELSEAE